ncbi:MAG TPA: ABC transporter permease [Anaerolineales bacterium]|nr:ABC transporter permease [Anaerolineales bacterium]
MRFFDLVALIADNLGRRKARVALTAIGVVIGTAAVVVLVSLALGLQKSANASMMGIGDLTIVMVEPNYGEGGPGPMMVEVAPGGQAAPPPSVKLITDDSLEELAALPGVSQVVPREWMQAGGTLTYERLETYPGITGLGVEDLSEIGLQAQSGSLALERGALVIGSNIPSSFYNPRPRPGEEMPEPPDLVGQTVKLTLMKWDAEGNETRKTVPVRVAGQIAPSGPDSDYNMFMSLEDVTAYNEWAMGRRVNRSRDGYPNAMVKVEKLDDVLDTADQIRTLGYRAYTQYQYVQASNSFYLILQVIFGGVGAISLLVAAIGIANTMTMAILERTREIGLMKAIGATNRDVLSVFLGEAAGIGFIGGLGGIIVGWTAGQIINVVVLAYMARQSVQTGAPPPTQAVFTPLWLPVFTLAFAVLIGLVSGLYPALRAANMIPVTALKYE